MTSIAARSRAGVRAAAVTVLALSAALIWTTPPPSTAIQLQPAAAHRPALVTIGTVPSVPGFPVSLDGVTRSTGPDGKAQFTALGVGDQLAGRVGLLQATLEVGGRPVRARATAFYPSRTAPVVSVDLSYLVRFQFYGRDGAAVDPAAIGTIVVKSDTGQVIGVPAGRPVWLAGNRVERVGTDLRVRTVNWRVQRVDYAGTDVVNDSQQQFQPGGQQDIGVELLFYRVRVHADDAIFGFSRAGLLKLVYPNGSSHLFSLTPHGDAALPALPRGDYSAIVLGNGPRLAQPLSVSRDQAVQLPMYSWWDVGTVLGILLIVAVALGWLGWARRRRPVPPTTTPVDDAAAAARQPHAGRSPRQPGLGTGLVSDNGS